MELNISDDDGVMDELEVVSKKRQYKGYREDESDDDADGSRSKHKRTITVNPTEGFSYSDIFLVSFFVPWHSLAFVWDICHSRTHPQRRQTL